MLSTNSQERKDTPITTGVLDYFPDAIAAVARLSKLGNDKHNPGEPLHWAKGKSTDEPDCIARHLIERGTIDPDDGAAHDVKLAWRALANLQRFIDGGGKVFDEEIIAKNAATLKAKLSAATPDLTLRDGDASSFSEPGSGRVIDERGLPAPTVATGPIEHHPV